MAKGLLDLFGSVGYVAAYLGGTIPSDIDTATAHVVIAGPDVGALRPVLAALSESGEGAAKVLVVARPGFSESALANSPRRLRVIEGRGDLYEVFERIAVPIGLDVRTDVFLSYSIRNLTQVETLVQALLDRGRRPWVDRRDLQPSDEWLRALRQGIEASDSFLFLVSRAAITSRYCLQELGWAVDLGKRIIPVLLEPIPADELPEAVRARQWIEVPPDGTLDDQIEVIVASLDRDPKIVHLHRQILLQALEWRRRDGDEGLLLRGSELAEAEDWLGLASARGEPRPTELHSTFVAASRQAGRSRQRKLWAIAAGVILLTTGLAIWAVLNAREAREKTDEARGRLAEQRAFGAYVAWEEEPVRAFLLADDAMRTAPDSDPLRLAYIAMTRNLVQQAPEVVTNLDTGVDIAALSPDLTQAFVRSSDRKSFVAPLTGRPGRRVSLPDATPFPRYREARFSFDGKLVAALYKPFFDPQSPYWLIVWRTDTGGRFGTVDLAALAGDRPPEIVGFTRDDRSIVLQATGEQRYDGYVLPLQDLASGLHHPVFHASSQLLLGQVDFSSSTTVQIDLARPGGGAWLVLLDLTTGTPRSEPVHFSRPVRQVFLARGGHTVAVVEEGEGGTGSRVSSWKLIGRTLQPVGGPLTSLFDVSLMDVVADGSTVAVLGKTESGYPAEIWSLVHGSRVSVPVRDGVLSPYIMKAGEEYRPLSFV
ncbi:MAG TPA: toll/interleukin-1 receptor domain-containing protein, partial [Thermoanaerobaculia bacterium]|nr:toll/interleukin-1 receptor domain-containing protein [Thermoanaerobaculia bacterium]